MHRFRTFIFIALACLLVLGVCAAVASAGHRAQSGDQKAKFASLTQTSQKSVCLSKAKSTIYVYITDTGAKYHRWGCRYLKYSHHKVTLKYAKSHGFKACKVCKPPK